MPRGVGFSQLRFFSLFSNTVLFAVAGCFFPELKIPVLHKGFYSRRRSFLDYLLYRSLPQLALKGATLWCQNVGSRGFFCIGSGLFCLGLLLGLDCCKVRNSKCVFRFSRSFCQSQNFLEGCQFRKTKSSFRSKKCWNRTPKSTFRTTSCTFRFATSLCG